jgi:pimeloyl-ACP methyl ester carboxylesterase
MMRGRRDTLSALLLVAVPILLACCAINRTGLVPVPTIAYPDRPAGRSSTLIVLLPGRRSHIGDFDRERFVAMARERGVDADLIEADLHLGYYLDGTYSTRIGDDVVGPARASGYERIWIVGISLGGSGAIGFAREHPDVLAGVVLLSPFLGPPEMLETIRAAGGLQDWMPDPSAAPGSLKWFIEQNWDFLKKRSATGGGQPTLFLGYGRDEPMGPSLDLLAESLPADHVVRVPGGHRWNTWQALWAEMLARHVFG